VAALKHLNRVVNSLLGRNKFKKKGRKMLKQEAILRLALQEEGVNDELLKIEIDHINGRNFINDICFPIIYPRSFFTASEKLDKEKNIDFYFNGNMSTSGERKLMLKPFLSFNSLIKESDFGRLASKKTVYNYEYFRGLASAKFGLCPHQKDFVGHADTMWTYRFIESCMCKAIPLIFIEAPLGKDFIDGFFVVNNCLLEAVQYEFSLERVDKNYELCKRRHSFISNSYLESLHIT